VNDDEIFSDIISDIFNEKTEADCSFGTIHLKHFKQLEVQKIFSRKERYVKEAVKKGVPLEKDLLADLIADGIWDNANEIEIKETEEEIKTKQQGLKNFKLPSQRKKQIAEINELKSKLGFLMKEKFSIMGITAEIYSERKVQKDFFGQIAFLDEDYKIRVDEELEANNFEQQAELQNIQETFFKNFDDSMISKAVLSSYFAPYLPYSESVLDFFGKPLKDLTTFQMKMLSYSRSFLNIFKNAQKDIPDNVAKDPELLISFYEAEKERSKNPDRAKNRDGAGATTYFGAEKEDLEQVKNENERVVTLDQELKKKGGTMNMEEMMKLHGL